MDETNEYLLYHNNFKQESQNTQKVMPYVLAKLYKGKIMKSIKKWLYYVYITYYYYKDIKF